MKNPLSIYQIARNRDRGFTLVELIVVVAIVGILTAIVIPSYTRYIVRSNRTAAESFIMSVANKQEQYILDARHYADSLPALNETTPRDVAENYTVSISNVGTAPPTYTVNAVPTGAQAERDTQCGTVSIDQAGTKSETGSGSVGDCW